MIRNWSCMLLGLIAFAPLSGTAQAQPIYSFTTIDPAGSSATFAQGVNNAGQIVGNFNDAQNVSHGFLRSSAGAYTTFDFPGATGTYAADINSAGQIIGTYTDSAFNTHSYLLSGGAFSPLIYPGSVQTLAYGINTAGQIVGGYVDSSQNRHGFLLSGGVYSTVDVPGAADNVGAFGINAAGHIVGVSGDANSVYGGYLRNAAGAFSPIGFPGADETDPIGINALGVITGFYVSGPDFLGFILHDGTYSTFPQAAGFTDTIPNKLNDLDQFVGTYTSGDGVTHGFLATPVPEPTSCVLLGIGGLAVMWRRRRHLAAPSNSLLSEEPPRMLAVIERSHPDSERHGKWRYASRG